MEYESLVLLRNITGKPQKCFVEGGEIEFPPHGESLFERGVAEQIQHELGSVIEAVDEDIDNEIDEAPSTTVWVGNFSGDPKAPETVKRRRWNKEKKFFENIDVENPLKGPRTIKRQEHPNEVFYTGPGGTSESYMVPVPPVTLPPYTRKELPKAQARWFLLLDRSNTHNKGMARKCRPKSDFEPDKNWALDDIRCWVRMCDKARNVGPSELELSRAASGVQLANDVYTAKREVLKHAFFCSADPAVTLPSRKAFEDFRASFEPVAEPPAPKPPKTPKRRGRPKKSQPAAE